MELDIDKINTGCKKKGKRSDQSVRLLTKFVNPEAKQTFLKNKRRAVAAKLDKLPKLSR
jgi:hypothetical protein